MYAIFMKKIDQPTALPIMHSQQTTDIKKARKYRKLEIAEADLILCQSNHPSYLWQLKDLKTNEVIRSTARDVLPIWNKMLGRV